MLTQSWIKKDIKSKFKWTKDKSVDDKLELNSRPRLEQSVQNKQEMKKLFEKQAKLQADIQEAYARNEPRRYARKLVYKK